MICPNCKKSMLSWTEEGQGTAYWCVGIRPDGSSCGHSVFEEEKTDDDNRKWWGFTKR